MWHTQLHAIDIVYITFIKYVDKQMATTAHRSPLYRSLFVPFVSPSLTISIIHFILGSKCILFVLCALHSCLTKSPYFNYSQYSCCIGIVSFFLLVLCGIWTLHLSIAPQLYLLVHYMLIESIFVVVCNCLHAFAFYFQLASTLISLCFCYRSIDSSENAYR